MKKAGLFILFLVTLMFMQSCRSGCGYSNNNFSQAVDVETPNQVETLMKA